MPEPGETDPIAKLMAHLAPETQPAMSLFLPLVPRRKFPPPDRLRLPPLVLVSITTDIAFQTIFPFLFGQPSDSLPSKAAFHNVIQAMAADNEQMIKRPLMITLHNGIEATLDLEFCFASRLLDRLRELGESGLQGRPYFYHFLVDLVCQAHSYADSLVLTTDDTDNYWLRLRGVQGYRLGAFFADVTILVQNFRNVVRIVFAERDDDFAYWDLYEWMSPIVKDVLLRQSLLVGPVEGNKQATILGRFLEKLAKLLAEKPR